MNIGKHHYANILRMFVVYKNSENFTTQDKKASIIGLHFWIFNFNKRNDVHNVKTGKKIEFCLIFLFPAASQI